MQSTMFVKGITIEKLPTTRDALFSQQALSQPDSSLVTSQLAASKSTLQPETKGWVMEEDNWFVQKLSSLPPHPDNCLELNTCSWIIGCNIAWCGWQRNPWKFFISAASPMIHACTNNFRLTSGEDFNYCINWSKASFEFIDRSYSWTKYCIAYLLTVLQ